MLWRGQVVGLPPERPLLLEDGERSEGVTAMQRDGMIQDMEYAHSELPVLQGPPPQAHRNDAPNSPKNAANC